jgi:hypothetical protein
MSSSLVITTGTPAGVFKDMKYSTKRIEEIRNNSKGVSALDLEEVYKGVLERDARIVELEEANRAFQDATRKNFEATRTNFNALEATQKLLDKAESELRQARDLADFYRADAYNSDVDGMRREDRIKNLERYAPSEETLTKLMTLCQDQGELTVGQRVDQIVEAYDSLTKELAGMRRAETELKSEIRTSKDRIQVLEKEAGNYRVKIGEMERRNPELKVDETLVPAWVKKKIDPTRWKVIAFKNGTSRVTIGVDYNFVHCRSITEFDKNPSEIWEDVLSCAFHIVDYDLGRPIGSTAHVLQDKVSRLEKELLTLNEHFRIETRRASLLQLQVDGMVENGVKAAGERINEVYAKQEALVQDAFERGKKAGMLASVHYLETTSDVEPFDSIATLRKAVRHLRQHLPQGVEDKSTDMNLATVEASFTLTKEDPAVIEQLKKVPGISTLEQVAPGAKQEDFRCLWCANIWAHDTDRVLQVMRATPGVKYAELAPTRGIQPVVKS